MCCELLPAGKLSFRGVLSLLATIPCALIVTLISYARYCCTPLVLLCKSEKKLLCRCRTCPNTLPSEGDPFPTVFRKLALQDRLSACSATAAVSVQVGVLHYCCCVRVTAVQYIHVMYTAVTDCSSIHRYLYNRTSESVFAHEFRWHRHYTTCTCVQV